MATTIQAPSGNGRLLPCMLSCASCRRVWQRARHGRRDGTPPLWVGLEYPLSYAAHHPHDSSIGYAVTTLCKRRLGERRERQDTGHAAPAAREGVRQCDE